jgi:alkanesulfonate monooxygenase SsuD/methylene tetrahydromethanopterin reductase-like flavin-dependent oxidoreductase (luciferase family)
VLIAGGSVAAARRAGRFGLGLIAQANAPGMVEAYHAACAASGHKPGFVKLPDLSEPTAIFVADDPDKAWNEIGPYLLHDARAAAAFRHGEEHVASISRAESVAELRAEEAGAYRVLSVAQASERLKQGKSLGLLPLCGGMPPDIAWPYLECAAQAVAVAQR